MLPIETEISLSSASKNKSAGIGEHPDIVQAIEAEVAVAAEAQDKLNMVNTILQDELELLLD